MGLSARATNWQLLRGGYRGPGALGAQNSCIARQNLAQSLMLDRFDRLLLNLVQFDSGRTADSLARDLPLSPSAIARRLRRHRRDGIIHRTISLLSPKLAQDRLRVIA